MNNETLGAAGRGRCLVEERFSAGTGRAEADGKCSLDWRDCDYLLLALQEALILLPVWIETLNREHLCHRGAFSAIAADRQAETHLSVKHTCLYTGRTVP